MIEAPVTAALVAYLKDAMPCELSPLGIEVRAHDEDEAVDGPQRIVVHVKSVKPRVRGTNLMNVAVDVTLRCNPHDIDVADFSSAWSWLTGAFYPTASAVAALTNDDLHCYTLEADAPESDVSLDGDDRERTLTLSGVIVGKNL